MHAEWILVPLLSLTSAVPGSPVVSADEAADGFISLFDGKTLNGWQAVPGYAVEDGMLVCKKGGRQLFTERQFGDFVFRFEFRLEPGGNNGVNVRGQEIQILDDTAPKHRNLKPCQYHGSIYCCVPAKRGHSNPPGQWNQEEIYCKGSHWRVTLNGTVIVDADLAKVPGKEDLARQGKGQLGFKGHGCRVEFRNLRIKPLVP